MKPITFSRLPVLLSSTVFLAWLFTACGSYQSSSYYDNDGIYGGSSRAAELPAVAEKTEQNQEYRQYFNSLQEKERDVIFTDPNSYTSYDTITNTQVTETAAGWGNESANVTVNVYDNWGWNNWYGPNWGWGVGWNSFYGPNWGWGLGWNSWYGPNWGWGLGWNNWYGANWGWGWNYPNWYNPYWGTPYANYYSYGGGRRGVAYSSRNYAGRQTIPFRSGSVFGRQTTRNNTRAVSTSAVQTTGTRTNQFVSPRSNSSGTRNSNGEVRNSSTRSYSAPSSSYGGSRGGSFSSGRSGGGRR